MFDNNKVEDSLEFEKGKTLLYGGREYIIVEVIGARTIKVGVGEIDLGNKHILKECMKKHPEDYAYCIAKWFIIQKKLTHLFCPTVAKANPKKDKKHIERMVKLDGLAPMDVIDILHFALTDKFWRDHLLNLSSLRFRAENNMLRWENILKSLTEKRKKGQL